MSAAKAVFVDTGAWFALRVGRDAHHERARRTLEQLRTERVPLVTTEWVLGETVTLLKARGQVEQAIIMGDAMQRGRLGLFLESTPERRRRAWDLFTRMRGAGVGWVDCTSLAVMEELGLREVFGFDDDFVKAGYALRADPARARRRR